MGNMKFSKEVCDELKYYVYRLVDPRNGRTFYVGKGKNNRVFSHVNRRLANTDEDNLKYKTINEIIDAGLEVIHIIQKYGLTEQQAFLVESVLIDAYSIERKLTNKIKGFNSSEPTNAITLQKNLSAVEFDDTGYEKQYMIIKVKDYWLNHYKNDRYECTRRAWKLNPEKANNYPYVLSVTGGIVKEIYKIDNNGWKIIPNDKRAEFTGNKVTDLAMRNIFINKKIPLCYRQKGQASPFLYSK